MRMKLKPVLKQKLDEDKKRHERIQNQYRLDDKTVVVVERNNTIKFLIRLSIRFLRMLIVVIIFLLSSIGLAALIYPSTRNAFVHELFFTLEQIRMLLNI